MADLVKASNAHFTGHPHQAAEPMRSAATTVLANEPAASAGGRSRSARMPTFAVLEMAEDRSTVIPDEPAVPVYTGPLERATRKTRSIARGRLRLSEAPEATGSIVIMLAITVVYKVHGGKEASRTHPACQLGAGHALGGNRIAAPESTFCRRFARTRWCRPCRRLPVHTYDLKKRAMGCQNDGSAPTGLEGARRPKAAPTSWTSH